jgi:serine/threonine protein kinase
MRPPENRYEERVHKSSFLQPEISMNLDPVEIAALLSFEKRYELRRQRWLDGPHESWEAFDRVLEREVVVNRAYTFTGVPGFIKRAKVASSLRHLNILPVYDLGVLEDVVPFYTTPLVPAMPLDHILGQLEQEVDGGESPFLLSPLVGVVRDACRAVEHAHRHGFLHLDLYPGSLLVGTDYREVLLDGGWEEMRAQREDADAFSICGRLRYMSPEQFDERGDIGPATDVFRLGGILHVVLFGTPPNHLPGRTGVVEVIRAVTDRVFEPRRPGTLRPQIRSRRDRKTAHELAAICLKSLAYKPEDRYPTAAALGEALDEWQGKSRSAWLPGLWRY